MAVPKRKHSKSRRNKKRTGKGLKVPQLVRCSQCNEWKKPHLVCPNCGYYKGKQIVVIDTEKTKK